MAEHRQTKHYLPVKIEKAAEDGYDARFVMSASTPDRVNDTIDPAAYRNLGPIPKLIALWQHKSDQPVGYWHDIKAEGGRLIGKLKLASTNLASMIRQLIDDGVPLGASIGFRGDGEPNKSGGIHFTTLELFECSVVSVPAHPRAVQLAKSFGFDPKDLGIGDAPAGAKAKTGTTRTKAVAALNRANSILKG